MEEKNWQRVEDVCDLPYHNRKDNIMFIAEVICNADREGSDTFGIFDCCGIL